MNMKIQTQIEQRSRRDLHAALLTIKEVAKPVAKINKLLKLSMGMEDEEFALHLTRMIQVYECYLAPRYTRTSETLPKSHQEWVEFANPIKKETIEFIQLRLADLKPIWQVIAEQHGWEPKAQKVPVAFDLTM